MSPTRRDLAYPPPDQQAILQGYSVSLSEKSPTTFPPKYNEPFSAIIREAWIDSEATFTLTRVQIKLLLDWGEAELFWLADVAFKPEWGNWRFICPNCQEWFPFVGSFLKMEDSKNVTILCKDGCRGASGFLKESIPDLKSKRIVEVDPN